MLAPPTIISKRFNNTVFEQTKCGKTGRTVIFGNRPNAVIEVLSHRKAAIGKPQNRMLTTGIRDAKRDL